MRIQFDSEQEYQKSAIAAVVDVFAGQPLSGSSFSFELEAPAGLEISEQGFANALDLEDDTLFGNVEAVQKRNLATSYQGVVREKRFTIEMETGTGKTYVYLRTLYELHAKYGWSKFVIVVPSVAIREGVLASIKLMNEHLSALYQGTPLEPWVYSSSDASRLRAFATSNVLQVLILNIQAFDKKDINVIHQEQDAANGFKWVDFIRASRPILILDEPQKISSKNAREALNSLDPLFELHYSATHREIVNPLYRLDPVAAYDQNLVKRIEVSSITETGDFNVPYVCVKSISTSGKPKVVLEINKELKGRPVRKPVTITRADADLHALSNFREEYRGWIVDGFDTEAGWVSFTNGRKLHRGQQVGADMDAVMRAQIRETIDRHLRRVQEMRGLPANERMKVLSLFFIDRVAHYAPPDGKLRLWFEEEYKSLTSAMPELAMPSVESVHNGYFASDKGVAKDSREGSSTEADRRAYELIMCAKEQLLSLDEPLQFIFSHSALSEGWDNPNVFQICTLREVHSEVDRRQKIGRGLRLPVQADGVRCRDMSRAILTVVANESFEKFASGLQNQIKSDFKVDFTGRVGNARKKRPVKLKKQWNGEIFMEIWERIRPRTRYSVEFSSEKLIEGAASLLKESPLIRRPGVKLRRHRLHVAEPGVSGDMIVDRPTEASRERYEVPDLLSYLQARTGLTRRTIAEILTSSGRLAEAPVNPQQFLDQALVAIDSTLRDFLVEGIKYEKVGEVFDQTIFEEEEIERFIDKLVSVKKSITDDIYYESDRERDFAKGLDALEDVQLFFKLPSRFQIETPIGTYNPDWAIVRGEQKRLYFIRETKGTLDPAFRRQAENAKIKCGQEHFRALGVDFATVASVKDLTA